MYIFALLQLLHVPYLPTSRHIFVQLKTTVLRDPPQTTAPLVLSPVILGIIYLDPPRRLAQKVELYPPICQIVQVCLVDFAMLKLLCICH